MLRDLVRWMIPCAGMIHGNTGSQLNLRQSALALTLAFDPHDRLVMVWQKKKGSVKRSANNPRQCRLANRTRQSINYHSNEDP